MTKRQHRGPRRAGARARHGSPARLGPGRGRGSRARGTPVQRPTRQAPTRRHLGCERAGCRRAEPAACAPRRRGGCAPAVRAGRTALALGWPLGRRPRGRSSRGRGPDEGDCSTRHHRWGRGCLCDSGASGRRGRRACKGGSFGCGVWRLPVGRERRGRRGRGRAGAAASARLGRGHAGCRRDPGAAAVRGAAPWCAALSRRVAITGT